MGEIINSRVVSDKVVYKVLLSEEEARQLKNHVKSVHLFSADLCEFSTRIIERGNKGGAKYFVIPLGLKSRKRIRYSGASYQKVDVGDEVFYICCVNKDPLF